MDGKSIRALLAMLLWTLLQCQAEPLRTVADIQDLLYSPSSQQYSIYILPDARHRENLRKRQIEFQDEVDEYEPTPEPEPDNKEDENEIQNDSKYRITSQDPARDHRYIQSTSVNRFINNAPRDTGLYTHDSAKHGNLDYVNTQPRISTQPRTDNQNQNFQYGPDIIFEGPTATQHTPIYITTFDPESQPGFSYVTELPDNSDSYVSLEDTSIYSAQTSEPPVYDPTAQTVYDTSYESYEPTTEYYIQNVDKPKLIKKFMDKPKKIMRVIKASPSGEYIPEEVPGVMVRTLNGDEEAFVPADLLEDTEKLLFSASAQQPTFVRPDQPIPSQVPRGMPYQFGYIVDDEATANYQTRQETGDINGVVTGCYQVLDPTGLVRTVIYRADAEGFRILSLSRGPDKTPCPGLDDATRSPIPSQAPTSRPQTPRPTFTNVGSVSNNNQFNSQNSNQFSSQSSSQFSSESSSQSSNQFNSQSSSLQNNQNSNQNALSQSSLSSSSSSSSKESSSSSSSSNQFSSFSGKNGLFEQPSYSKTLPPQPSQTTAANQYATAQQAWMAEYLQNITKNLYNSYTNSSTFTNTNTYGVGGNSNGLVNFPFVLIPITTFLDLQQSGAIGKDVQSYGAFIQPGNTQSQLSQLLAQQQLQRQQDQQKQKTITETTKHTLFNTYNTSKAETQQNAFKSQGVNSINYQINGAQQQGNQAGKQVQQQQQFQRHQSSQSSKSSQSSNSASSTQQSSFTGNQGIGGANQAIQQQYQNQQSSQSSKSSQSNSNSFNSNFHSNFAGNQALQGAAVPSTYGSRPNPVTPGVSYGPPPPKATVPTPAPQTFAQPRPSIYRTTPQPTQYRPSQPSLILPQQSQNLAQPSFNNGDSSFFSSQSSQSSKESQSSDSKQAFSSNSKLGNGLASQNFQSSSSKNEKSSSENSKSSSSSQFSFNGAGGSVGNQHSSSAKSSSSKSSSSSSSSQQSFNGFSSGVIGNAPSFLPTHLTQGFAGFPEPRPSPSSLNPTFIESSPSSVNSLPKSTASKPVPHQSYQEVPNPIILEESKYEVSKPNYGLNSNNNEYELSLLSPAPEPESVSMEGWVPITNQFISRSTENPSAGYIQNFHPVVATPAEVYSQYQQHNQNTNPGLLNDNFHFSSSSQSSQKESSSEQKHQQSSSSFSTIGAAAVSPRQLYGRDIHQSVESIPSQKQPRHLLNSQVYQSSLLAAHQQSR